MTLDGQRNDGGPGENDLVGTDVEDVVGSSFDDVLSGGPGDDVLDGGAGDDVLDGRDGSDILLGESGNDTIAAADGVEDGIDCGDGTDSATVDVVDLTFFCEQVTGRTQPLPTPTPTPPAPPAAPAPPATPVVVLPAPAVPSARLGKVALVHRTTLVVTVGCPSTRWGACHGTLTATSTDGKARPLGHVAFNVPAGKTRTLRIAIAGPRARRSPTARRCTPCCGPRSAGTATRERPCAGSRSALASRTVASICLACLATLGLATTSAHAAFVDVTSVRTLNYQALDGEQNSPTFTITAGSVAVADPTAPLTAGDGCTHVDAHHVTCVVPPEAPADLHADLGDRDDSLGVTGAGSVWVMGGDGNDTITATNASSLVTLYGAAGDDRLQVDGGSSADLLGGPGNDVLDSSSLHGQLKGEDGDDQLRGGPSNDDLDGGAGDDQLDGEGGADTFHGEPGADVVTGGLGIDTIGYSSTSSAQVLSVTLDGIANDGVDGEGDNVQRGRRERRRSRVRRSHDRRQRRREPPLVRRELRRSGRRRR